jgi:hypothetical protein
MRRLIRFVLSAAVFGLGLVVGGSISINKRAADFSAGVERRLAEGGSVSQPRSPSSKVHFATQDELVTALMSTVAERDPLLRAYQLRELIGNLNSEELAVVFERAVRVEDRIRRSSLLVPLLSRWAEIDLAAATAAVKPYRDRARNDWRVDWRGVESAIVDAWAEALPESALAEVAANPNAWWAWTTAQSSLDALSNGDPAKKLAELLKLPEGRLRDRLCGDAFRALAAKDYAAAEDQLNAISDPRKRSRLQADILGKLAEKDAAAAVDRMIDLASDLAPGLPGLQLVNKVMRAVAKQNPSDALAAVERLPEELRSQAQGAALIGWASQNPIDALDWALANDVNVRDTKAFAFFGDGEGGGGWNTLISAAVESDREKTLAWIRSQAPSTERDTYLLSCIWNASPEQRLAIYADLAPESRKSAIGNVINGDRGTDVSKMESWIKELPAGGERVTAIRAFASTQTYNTPERLDSIAEDWPEGPERDAAFRGIATALVQNNPQLGLEYARQITDPKTRSHAFSNIASSWLYGNEAAARAWISSTSELSADDKRVLIREFEER